MNSGAGILFPDGGMLAYTDLPGAVMTLRATLWRGNFLETNGTLFSPLTGLLWMELAGGCSSTSLSLFGPRTTQGKNVSSLVKFPVSY